MFKADLKLPMLAIVLTTALAASSLANAQSRDERAAFGGPHVHFDGRFSHNHIYHDRGYVVRGVPRDAYRIRRGGGEFFYHGGEWYRRNGSLSIVVAAPIGALVPVLPPYYSTVWWAGVPYYYADDTYYSWNAGANEYEVVGPPDGIESSGSTVAPNTDSIFIYPKNGQSAAQQDRDKYDCHRSAVQATGYDPTLAGGGVPADIASNKRSDYMRADAACLDARGYSVK
jgi:hypothetical protein